jgi:alkanesulfonate monooxygenase
MVESSGTVQIVGMIGVQREAPETAGAALSVFGGGINPGGEIPAGIDPDYIAQFARVHEQSGFDLVLTGYSSSSPDGFEVAGFAAAHTQHLGFLIAHRPGFVMPTLAARKAATLDQFTGGRIALHIISGGSDTEQRQDGDWLDHDARYRRTAEYMEVLRRVWTESQPFDHQGEFYRFQGAYSQVRCLQQPHVPLFFGGASQAALSVGSRWADVYAFLGEPLSAIRERIADLRRRAAGHGRGLRFSLSVRPILGDAESQAWERARGILERVQQATRGKVAPGQAARGQSELSQRLVDFAAQQEVYDKRLWMPIAYASGGAGNTTCLVGTAEQVAESLLDYYRAGCTTFILRGFDPLNDAAEYGRELIPLLRERVPRL